LAALAFAIRPRRAPRAHLKKGYQVAKAKSETLPKLTTAEVVAFFDRVFRELQGGQGNSEPPTFVVEEVGPMMARLRLIYHPRHLRPGGTISGPSMFALADAALYAAVLAQVGLRALAVTTNLNINFLRRPEPGNLIGEARLLKLGKRLAVGEVLIHSEATEELVAHATGTYSIPEA
jgi:uncharacterized protein (TIGR00369 family)